MGQECESDVEGRNRRTHKATKRFHCEGTVQRMIALNQRFRWRSWIGAGREKVWKR